MALDDSLSETMYIRLSKEDKKWITQRAMTLTLRPTSYARMLLSKAVEIDRCNPGKIFAEAV